LRHSLKRQYPFIYNTKSCQRNVKSGFIKSDFVTKRDVKNDFIKSNFVTKREPRTVKNKNSNSLRNENNDP
jgi:hypothetical protein